MCSIIQKSGIFMADYKMYKLFYVSVHMLHKFNMPTHVITLLYKPKKLINKPMFMDKRCQIRNAIQLFGIRAFCIDCVKVSFLKQVGEGYRGEAFAIQHVLLDQVYLHTFKVLRRHLRYAQLSSNERVGALYTLRADSLDCFLLNFSKFSLPRITLMMPTKSSRDIMYERRICIAKKAKKKKIVYSFPIRTGLNKLLFFYGLDEDYRTYHAFLERVFYGVILQFESVLGNYFYTRVIISHYGIPIN